MSLRFREKQSFYHSLEQLLRSGVTFPAALRTLAPSSRGSLRRLLHELNQSVESGHTIAEAFAARRPVISEMEIAVVDAVERAGKLDRGLAQLGAYFDGLAKARAHAVKKAAYPVFMLHLGVLLLGVATLVNQGMGAYLREVGSIFALIYAFVFGVAVLVPMLSNLGGGSTAIDALLRRVPLIGSIRKNFAVSRFCSTYGMQLDAGVNVMDSLKAAARASRSSLIATNVARALPEVAQGNQVSPLLSRGGAFPATMLRDLAVGEQTGRLDVELERLAALHRDAALSTLDIVSEWLPRLLYFGVAGYIGFRVVDFYAGYFKQIDDLMK